MAAPTNLLELAQSRDAAATAAMTKSRQQCNSHRPR